MVNFLIEKLVGNPRDKFIPDEKRVEKYLSLDRSTQPRKGLVRHIPIGGKDEMIFVVEDDGWTTDRAAGQYEEMVFGDEFLKREAETVASALSKGEWQPDEILVRPAVRVDRKPLYGGIREAFGAGKRVLELGSGEALALLQWSLEFRNTIFIGIDTGYTKRSRLSLGSPGVQLSRDDWLVLRDVPDNSIDTVLSCEGPFRHALPSSTDDGVETAHLLLSTVTRVAKEGAVLRFNYGSDGDGFLHELFRDYPWDVQVVDDTAVAKKTSVGR